MRQATRSRETLQLCAFIHGQLEGRFGTSGEHSAAYRCPYNIASYLWDTTLVEYGKSIDYAAVNSSNVKGSAVTIWRKVSRNKSEFFRRSKRKVISSK